MPLLCEKVDCITYIVKEIHDPKAEKLCVKRNEKRDEKRHKANKTLLN